MKRFVIGDIHGQFLKLKKVLELSNFNYEKDQLISLGDIVDRGPDPVKCFEELFKIKNLISIRGNHDEIFMTWIMTGIDYFNGRHGVEETHNDWIKTSDNQKEKILAFLRNQINFYFDKSNNLFVHGGIDRDYTIEQQQDSNFYWDRKMIQSALSCKNNQTLNFIEEFNKIFVGHTPTITFEYRGRESCTIPVFLGNKVWAIDTGAPFDGGKLTIMNIETEEYFQA